MTTYNFDLLDLADGESGDAAVSVVVSKKKTEAAAAAKPADHAEPTAQEKSKDFYYTKLQHDEGVRLCKQERGRLGDVLTKLRAEEKKLKEQPGNNEARLEELLDEQRKLTQEKSKLSDQERELVLQKEAFYRTNRMTLSRDDCRDTKLKFDEGLRLCKQEHRKLRDALQNLTGEETKLKKQPGNNEARLEELSDEQWKLMQEQSKLWHQERELLLQKEAFYRENRVPLSFDDYRYAKQQLDEGVRLCRQEVFWLRNVLIKLRVVETKLREQPGNEARLKELSDEQCKLRQEQRKLRVEEANLLQQKEVMVREYEEEKPNNNSQGANEDSGSNYNSVNGNYNDGGSCGYSDYGGNNDQYQTEVCDGAEHYPHGHDERQVGRGHYGNGDRQGYRQGPPRMIKVYRPKVKASSDAGTEAEVPEASVVSANDTEQKDTSADNADAVPASESDKSAAGGAAQDGPRNGQGGPNGTNIPFQRKGTVNGSEKRKKKNAKKNSGTEPDKVKQDSEGDGSRKQADNQPQPEETKTLAEYERMREEKRKSSEASKPEERKVTAEEFKDCQMLEKKKLDDEEVVIKVEKPQPKLKEASKKGEVQAEGKEAAAKDGKPKKVTIPHQWFSTPRRVTYNLEGGSFSRVHFNDSFQGGSRGNSTEPRVNGREPQNEAGGHNGNGAPRSAYNAQGDGAMRGDYSGHRDGYMGNGRGNGRYGYGRGNGGYGGRGQGGYQGNGGYQQQQGGNVGRYQQERDGNGGNYQQRRYQQRRNFVPVPNVKDVYKFPALPVPASARSVPASETATAPAKASAAAPSPSN
ncbi:unnamed protein product [Urochloa decumbens]|uniref:Uncharacterized protein n=1 Tax=Urochloa decumbens TaxID=240449 RepID=A0ABC8Y6X8_9POAL